VVKFTTGTAESILAVFNTDEREECKASQFCSAGQISIHFILQETLFSGYHYQ